MYQMIKTGITAYFTGNRSIVTHLGCSFDFDYLTNNCTVLETEYGNSSKGK